MMSRNKEKQRQMSMWLAPEDAEDGDCRRQDYDAQHIEHDANVDSINVRLNR